VARFPAPASGSEVLLLWGHRGNASGGDVFREPSRSIALRSQFGHWALRSESAWGTVSFSPLPVTQPRFAQDWRGFFVKGTFTPAASFLRMPSWLEVAKATYLAACQGWPGTPITLRQGTRVIEDSRRTRTSPPTTDDIVNRLERRRDSLELVEVRGRSSHRAHF
jgi:hypothetical protein